MSGITKLGLVVVLGVAMGLSTTAFADPIRAVRPSGNAVLVKCRSWIFFHTCKPYDKIELPQQVTVGDKVQLSSFGSSPKDYVFHVVEIRQKGEGCLLLSDVSKDEEDRERIEVARCEPLPPPSGGSR